MCLWSKEATFEAEVFLIKVLGERVKIAPNK